MKQFLRKVDIEARDLSEALFRCIRGLFDKGYIYMPTKSSSGKQRRLEFDYVSVQINFPGTRPLIPLLPPGIPPIATEKYVIEDYLPYVFTSEKKPNEDYTYGQDLEEQIELVVNHYKKFGHELNHCVMTVGDKNSLRFYEKKDGTSQCLRLIDTRIRYGKLHFMVYFRSWDLWAGFPVNLAAIQLLKEDMAKQIGVEDGEIIASSKGLHLYDYSWEVAAQATGYTLGPEFLKREEV